MILQADQRLKAGHRLVFELVAIPRGCEVCKGCLHMLVAM